MDSIDRYLMGTVLYGDDFGPAQIAEWYADEQEGYADLGARDAVAYRYGYHAWNRLHAYRHLPDVSFDRVLGFGSAYGDELLPIIARVRAVTIVDPSAAFVKDELHGVPATYVRPAAGGELPLADSAFDLITCFGVLHHIPNVSFVMHELTRTLKPGGYMLLREPIVSMGDWRKPRPGLTRRERGIPLSILDDIVDSCGLIAVRRSLCGFPVISRALRMIRPDPYNSALASWIDAGFASAFSWNLRYHARSSLDRLRPTSAFFVLHKSQPVPVADSTSALGSR